jgi:arsenate reductase-like glutaredoxin family protein
MRITWRLINAACEALGFWRADDHISTSARRCQAMDDAHGELSTLADALRGGAICLVLTRKEAERVARALDMMHTADEAMMSAIQANSKVVRRRVTPTQDRMATVRAIRKVQDRMATVRAIRKVAESLRSNEKRERRL